MLHCSAATVACAALTAATCLFLCVPVAVADPCTFKDGGDGFTTIGELGVRKFVERATKEHVIARALVPSQKTEDGDITILFDTPTKDVDEPLDVTAQTSGTTDVPVKEVVSASSVCVPYKPEMCFRLNPLGGQSLLNKVQ